MPDSSPLQQNRTAAKHLINKFFKLDGEPAVATDGQADIFNLPFLKLSRRQQLIGPTQYGKSEFLAMGTIMRSRVYAEPFSIVATSEPKAGIIMGKVIDHLFDHEFFYRQLELDPNEPLDRLRRERSKRKVNFKQGGEIQTVTADARNRQRVKESLTGLGSKNIIEDEAPLIPDDLQAMVLRMLGGHQDSYLLKNGNPFFRNHFYRTSKSPHYQNLFIDYHQALAEGRFSQAFIDEMRNEPFFDVLYECLFPQDDEVDAAGWRRLLNDSDIEKMFELGKDAYPQGKSVLGVDVGGGSDETAMTVKYDNVAWLAHANKSVDLMANVAIIRDLHEEHKFQYIVVDDTGIGHGLSSRPQELNFPVVAFAEGASATEPKKYANAKAEVFWLSSRWGKNGGALKYHERFREWENIRYKEDSSSRLAIEPKAKLREKGLKSPDYVDSFTLCFAPSNMITADDFQFM